jgi:hypothetical protein
MNGPYGFVYSGFEGEGLGVFRVIGSELTGVDLGGVRYRGHVRQDQTTGE